MAEEQRLTKNQKKELRKIEWQEKARLNARNEKIKKYSIWGIGTLIVIGAIAGTFLSAFSTVKTGNEITDLTILIIIFILAVAYFFPILFLFRFSKYSAHAVHTLSKADLHKAIKNLKACFAYFGVLIIIILTIYILVLIVAGSSLAFLKGL